MRFRRAVVVAVIVVATAWYARLLAQNIAYAAGGSDSSGYLNEARMFARGRMSVPVDLVRSLRVDPGYTYVFVPLGFTSRKPATMVPTYPAGLPVHFMVAAVIGGWERAPFWVSPMAAIGCLLLTYAIGRKLGLNEIYAFAAAALLAAFPPFLLHAVQPISDVVATFWTLAMILFSLHARVKPVHAVFAGICFGIGVWVRPTNLLMVVPLVIALRFRWPLLLRGAAGAIPLGVALMWINYRLFGSPFMTGYGGLGDVVAFDLYRDCFAKYSLWLAQMMTPLIYPIGLLVVFDRRVERWDRALLPAWFAMLMLFYPLWAVYDGWWYTRFLLPGIPGLILGSLFVLRDALEWSVGRWRPIIATAAAVAVVYWMIRVPVKHSRKHAVLLIDEVESIYPNSVKWTEELLPDDALLVSGVLGGAFYYYSGRLSVRYDLIEAEQFQLLRAYAGSAGKKWYAVLSAVEIPHEEFLRRLPGKWVPVSKYRDLTLWRLDE